MTFDFCMDFVWTFDFCMDFVWTLLDFSMVLSMETKSFFMVCKDGYGLV